MSYVLYGTTILFGLLGLFHSLRPRTDGDAFLSSRNRFGAFIIFGSVVSSAMGVWILFSPPQVGSEQGISGVLGYALGAASPLLLFSLIGPRVRRLVPLGEGLLSFVRQRFGARMARLIFLIMLFYMSTYLVAELTAIAKAATVLAGGGALWIPAAAVMFATVLYTALGGLGTSIFTDVVQFVFMVPLLLVTAIVTLLLLGGWNAAVAPLRVEAPELLNVTSGGGIRMGISLLVAVMCAEFFNQVNWQRIYASRDARTVRSAYFVSSLCAIPMILVAGALGLFARHFGFRGDTAFFVLLNQVLKLPWLKALVLVLALTLVMSTMSALLNAIASVATSSAGAADVKRVRRGTFVLALVSVGVAALGLDVLYLFLLADLVCVGAFLPVLVGLSDRRPSEGAFLASVAGGIVAGILFFPKPDFTPWNALPGSGDLFVSYVVAIGASALVLAAAWSREAWARRGSEPVSELIPR